MCKSTNKKIDKTIVSSDNDNIIKIANSYGADTIKRPKNLAADNSPTEASMIHALKK